MTAERQGTRLPIYLALAYAALVAYACLYPLAEWRDIGAHPLDFLSAPWPKYYTWLDLALNVQGFVPLGFTAAAALRRLTKPGWAIVLVTLGGALFSLSLEVAQNYLPTRVPSNLDIGTNTLGALLGAALGSRWASVFDHDGPLHRWRRRRFLRGHIGEIGMILVALWWLTQLEPTSMLFATGDLRPLFELPAPLAFSAYRYIALEAAIVTVQLLAIGLVLRRCTRSPAPLLLAFVILVGLVVKTIATYSFMWPPQLWHWASPGAMYGLACGSLLLGIMWRMPGWVQHVVACMALLCATAMVNLAPENPFELATMRMIHEGHFLNFHGVTRMVASLWPFFALAYLTAQGAMAATRR